MLFGIQLFSPVVYNELQAELYMSVSGRVIAEDTEKGLKDVKIILVKIENDKPTRGFDVSETDERGEYLFDMVPPGEYWIFTYPIGDYILEVTPRKVVVSRGKNLVDLNFVLQRGGTISGVAYEKESIQPLGNVYLIAKSEDGVGMTITNENGEYKISNLRPGSKYFVFLLRKGYVVEFKESINVLAEEITGNVNLTSDTNVRVSINGVMKDSFTGKPIENVFVALIGQNGGGWDITTTSGDYQVKGMPSDAYTVVAMAQGYETLIEDGVNLNLEEIKTLNLDLKPSVNGDILLLKGSNRNCAELKGNNFLNSIVWADTDCSIYCRKQWVNPVCNTLTFASCCALGARLGGGAGWIGAAIGCIVLYFGCYKACPPLVQIVCEEICEWDKRRKCKREK